MHTRTTRQRQAIARCFERLHHPTAEEVWQCVQDDCSDVSITTVYRNLNRLVEEGRVRRLESPDGTQHFDHLLHKHYHVRCRQCGRIDDVALPPLHDLENQVETPSGYRIEDHDVVFIGVCPQCQAASEKRDNK